MSRRGRANAHNELTEPQELRESPVRVDAGSNAAPDFLKSLLKAVVNGGRSEPEPVIKIKLPARPQQQASFANEQAEDEYIRKYG